MVVNFNWIADERKDMEWDGMIVDSMVTLESAFNADDETFCVYCADEIEFACWRYLTQFGAAVMAKKSPPEMLWWEQWCGKMQIRNY